MKPVAKSLLLIVLAAMLASPVSAEDKEKKKGKRDRGGNAALQMTKGLDLTAEQQEKVKAIGAEFAPKLQAAREKANAIVTPEMRKARMEAMKAAKDAGKKGKEVKEAGDAAVNLTDAQKESIKSARQESAAIMKEMRSAVTAVLTDEQKAKLSPPREKKKK